MAERSEAGSQFRDDAWLGDLIAMGRIHADLVVYPERLERQNSERRQMRTVLTSILSSASDGLIMVDRHGSIARVSRARRRSLSFATVLAGRAAGGAGGGAGHPLHGVTQSGETGADPGYSWCKAPSLVGQTMEAGALVRQVVDGHPLAWTLIVVEGLGGAMFEAVPCGHWLWVEKGRIAFHHIIAPTMRNFGPGLGGSCRGSLLPKALTPAWFAGCSDGTPTERGPSPRDI